MTEEFTEATQKPATISFFAHEQEVNRQERHIKRLIKALIVALVLMFASNIAWLAYESMYDTVSYAQDGAGVNNINTGTQGDVLSGAEAEDQAGEEALQSTGSESPQS